MVKLIARLNLFAICLLAGVLASVLAVRVWPQVRAVAGLGVGEDETAWPRTLQVHPAHPGDPATLVRIIKEGNEVVPGKYVIPRMEGTIFSGPNPLDDWLKDASFVVRNQTSRNIVCVGISVVFPARRPEVDCPDVIAGSDYRGHNAWCEAHPHWCDGGCPVLIQRTLQWGRIPASVATGLEVRLRAINVLSSPILDVPATAQTRPWRGLPSGEDAVLSQDGRRDGLLSMITTRGLSHLMNTIVHNEGLDEARDAEPCVAVRQYWRFGCAFAEVQKFNVGLDVVYFEDGTIWGNYGYGYALPNPDGIFTRLEGHDSSSAARPGPAPN